MYDDKPVGFTAVNRLNNAPRELPPENDIISALFEDDFLYHIVDSCHSGSLVTLKGYDGKVAGSSGSNPVYKATRNDRDTETLEEVAAIPNMFESTLGYSSRRLSAHGTYERVHMKINNKGSAPKKPSNLFGLLGDVLYGNNNSIGPAQSRMASSNKEYDEYKRRL